MPAITPEELLPDEVLAAELQVQKGTLTNWRASGRGPDYLKVGRQIFYRRTDVNVWLGSLLRQPQGKTSPPR
jgi:hypothetical protein